MPRGGFKRAAAALIAVSFVLLVRMYATLPDINHRMPLFAGKHAAAPVADDNARRERLLFFQLGTM